MNKLHFGRFYLALLLIACVIFFSVTPGGTAQAATFTVGTAAELITAINDANLTPVSDTIILTRNITLTGVDNNTVGPNGLPVITTPIIIEGAGFNIQRNNAAPDFRFFYVDVGGDLTINETLIRNGRLSTGFVNGGGIYVAGTLTMTESTVRNNVVAGIFPSGGGIYNATTGTVTLINTDIRNNVADNGDPAMVFDYGGGIYSQGTLTLQNTTVRNNTAAENGGGIWASGVTTINNSVIANNSAFTGGGLISFGGVGGIFRINNTTFSGNVVSESGGAILNGNDDVQIFGSTFINNTVQDSGGGGAIFNVGGTIDITASVFEGNRALGTAIGGAVVNVQLGEINMYGSIVRNNSTLTNGGGLVSGLATFNVFDSLITGNSANGGGGIYGLPSNVTPTFAVHRSTISNNTASFLGGGALFEGNQTTSFFYNSTFTGNSSPTFGGGIGLNAGGQVAVHYSTIAENNSTQFINSVGGANFFAGTATVEGTIIANNNNTDCSATNASTSLGFNVSTSPAGGIPVDRWCSFIPLDPTDLPGTDPLLSPLAANGNIGVSYTLQAGSPALDINPGACPGVLNGIDQRGVPRTGGTCDAGSISGDTVILPEIYFATPTTVIRDEGSAPGTQFVDLVIDNTNGNFNAPTTLPLTIYVIQSGTAADAIDFNSTQPAVMTFTFDAATFPAPGTSTTIQIGYDVIDDLLVEGNEIIDLNMIVIGPGVLDASRSTHRVTIIDDDEPPVTVAQTAPVDTIEGGVTLFDPAISKIGLLVPGQTGVTGEQLEWVVTVRNIGSTTGTNIIVTDTLNPGLRVDSVDAPGSTVSINGQVVTVTIPSLAPGDGVQFSIFTTVIGGVTIVENTACVTGSQGEVCATALPVTRLPQTGEIPLWRTVLIAIVGLMVLAGIGFTIRRYTR